MTNEPKASDALDPELLAAYLDQRLPPEARAIVEARLATDSEAYELLVELIHTRESLKDQLPHDEEQPEPEERPAERPGGRKDPQAGIVPLVPKAPKTKVWAIAGGVLAVAAALVMVVRLQPELLQRLRGGEAVDPQLAKLVAAVGEERYIEARLTGGFKYGPLRSVTRGPMAIDNLSLAAAAAELDAQAKAAPTAQALHRSGVARLLTGDIDGAIDQLSQAGASRTATAQMYSDLAAAYSSRAIGGQNPDDWSRAFDAAQRAVELAEAPLPEALFNRALAATRSGRPASAQYWQDYLAVEPSSEWRQLARSYQ